MGPNRPGPKGFRDLPIGIDGLYLFSINKSRRGSLPNTSVFVGNGESLFDVEILRIGIAVPHPGQLRR